MDLDRFKFVNDFYGHLEGDVVLQRVGHILEQNCRRSDVVARYGGDEFVILMPETSVEQAYQLASKLRGWVASDPLLRDKKHHGELRHRGIPGARFDAAGIDQVADSSMYLSKHQGGNAVSSAEQGDPNETRALEERCSGSVPGRDAEAAVLNGARSVRRNLSQARAVHAFVGAGRRRTRREDASGDGRDGDVARAGDRCEAPLHAGPFAESCGVCGGDRAGTRK